MQLNRRRTPRARIDVLVNAFQDGLPALCAATDVSEGGIGLRRVHHIRTANRDSVDIEFVLPGFDEVICARGRLEERGGASAVVFDWVADADRALIRSYVGAA